MILLETPLHRYLFRLVGDPASADDLLQDVLLVLWRKLVWLRDPDMLRPWAFRIASRTAFKWLRKHGKMREEPLDAAAEVLRLVGRPLHYKEITDIAIEKNLLSHVGKSPEVTMGARLAALSAVKPR